MFESLKRLKNIAKKKELKYTVEGIDYVEIVWLSSYLTLISQGKTPLKRFVLWYSKRQTNKLINSLRTKSLMKPSDLLEFVKFYVATKDMFEYSNKRGSLKCTLSTISSLRMDSRDTNNLEFFKIKYMHGEMRLGTVEICTSPTTHGNIEITITAPETVKSIEHSKTMSRMFLDTNENNLYRDVWMAMLDYIEKFINSGIK